MNASADQIQRYRTTWTRVLTTVRGCSQEEAERWAAPFVEAHPELTLHEPAAYWVAGALAGPEFRGKLGMAALAQLHRDIQYALDQGDDFWMPVEDLGLAHSRVLTVLDRYREMLPADIASDVLKGLSRSEAFDVVVRAIRRQRPQPVIIDTVSGQEFAGYSQIPFGKTRRLKMRYSAGNADFWYDAFGLNLVLQDANRAQAMRLLGMLRTAFYGIPHDGLAVRTLI